VRARTRLVTSVVVLVLLVSWLASVGLAKPREDMSQYTTREVHVDAPTMPYPGTDVGVEGVVFYDCGVILWAQCATGWGTLVMQTCGDTICKSGCCLTSVAMVFTYYGATAKNPAQLNTCMGNMACLFSFTHADSNCDENKATLVAYCPYSLSTMRSSILNNGDPPILYLKKIVGSVTYKHWVVVRRINGDDGALSSYWINDPAGGKFRCLTDYTNNGWVPTTLAIYGLQ